MTIVETGAATTLAALGYFAKLIGAPMLAVIAPQTSRATRERIAEYGAVLHEARSADLREEAARLARSLDGLYLNQFEIADAALDWRGNHSLAETLFNQFAASGALAPDWVVLGASTGATASIGRYIRSEPEIAQRSKLCVVDSVGSAFMASFRHGETKAPSSPVINEIGAGAAGGAFAPQLIDRMIAVPDAAAVAACLWFERASRQRVGLSTGANLVGALALLAEMRRQAQKGAVATFIAGGGDAYADTVFNPAWRAQMKFDEGWWKGVFERFERDGEFPCALDAAEAPFD